MQTGDRHVSDNAWRTIRYPHAVFDEQLNQRVSDAEVAEVPFTAFASRGTKHAVTARPIERRVRDQNPDHLVAEQGELFPTWRHHAVFNDSASVMLQAEADHRRHAIIEQVAIADLKNGPLTHLPSERFNANGAWLVLAAMAFNLTRAVGAMASAFHARATTATIRRQLINIPAWPVRFARRIHPRLPTNRPWADAWLDLFTATLASPTATAA